MSIFNLSPGVFVNELDLTAIIPAVSVSAGAIAGVFSWGPIHEHTLIDSEATLVARFGTPTNDNFETWFTAASFLAYASTLWVVRGANTTSADGNIATHQALANVGTVSNVVHQITKNDKDYLNKIGTYDENVLWIAKYPGLAGNSLRISVVDNANAYSSNIDIATSTANGSLLINAGSNTAFVVVGPIGVGVIGDATALATTVHGEMAEGDLIQVGNSTIGQQFVQVTNVGSVQTNATNSWFELDLLDPYRLSVNWHSEFIPRFWEFHFSVGRPPGQSWWVENFGNGNPSNDEMHVVVVDEGGYFTGEPGAILETHKFLSRATDALNMDGTNNYYATVMNKSRYIRWTNDDANAVSNSALYVTNSFSSGVVNLRFNGGTDGASESNVAVNMITNAYALFQDPEDIDVGLVMTGKSIGGVTGEQIGNWILDNICLNRRDCVGFVSPNLEAVVDNYGNEVQSLLDFRYQLRSTSYGVMDSGYKQMYDNYNNYYRWVPMNGDIAGLCARTDETNDPWWAPAGYNRGQLKNLVRLAFNPNKTARDILFPANINPVVTFHLDGTILFGDKTLQARASAFDAINVRRLFIVLEKAISKASKYFLWEFNDAFTQAQFRNMVNPYLRIIKGRRGITDFLVKCDSSNNPPEIVDQDIMVGDIYIKPARAIRFIQLNFIATPTGVNFSEVSLSQAIPVT